MFHCEATTFHGTTESKSRMAATMRAPTGAAAAWAARGAAASLSWATSHDHTGRVNAE